eukprot:jgi/Chlat1/2034/Chrsp159S02330
MVGRPDEAPAVVSPGEQHRQQSQQKQGATMKASWDDTALVRAYHAAVRRYDLMHGGGDADSGETATCPVDAASPCPPDHSSAESPSWRSNVSDDPVAPGEGDFDDEDDENDEAVSKDETHSASQSRSAAVADMHGEEEQSSSEGPYASLGRSERAYHQAAAQHMEDNLQSPYNNSQCRSQDAAALGNAEYGGEAAPPPTDPSTSQTDYYGPQPPYPYPGDYPCYPPPYPPYPPYPGYLSYPYLMPDPGFQPYRSYVYPPGLPYPPYEYGYDVPPIPPYDAFPPSINPAYPPAELSMPPYGGDMAQPDGLYAADGATLPKAALHLLPSTLPDDPHLAELLLAWYHAGFYTAHYAKHMRKQRRHRR